jgi:anti-sigma factor RsiW
MSTPLSPHDLEQLSAYLDGALSPPGLTQLKARLDVDLAFASALKAMLRTRAALRRAPQRRVPRSFTLTHQMLGNRRASVFSDWTSLNFASAVATLLLAFALIGDFSTNVLLLGGGAPSAAEAAPQTLMVQPPTATPELELFAQDRQTKAVETTLDWSAIFQQYVADIELGLGGVALLTGMLAWRQKRRS